MEISLNNSSESPTVTNASTIKVKNANADGGANITVYVPGLHEEGQSDTLGPGEKEYYRFGDNTLRTFTVSSDGAADVVWSPVARNTQG